MADPRFRTVFTDLITAAINAALAPSTEAKAVRVIQTQHNGLYGVHQITVAVDVPGHKDLYRVLIAPSDAPVFIGTEPANDHFPKSIAPQSEG